jgi:hypothetical protein
MLKRGEIGFSLYQRRWAELSLDQTVIINPKMFGVGDPQIMSLVLTADFSLKKKYAIISILNQLFQPNNGSTRL